MTSETNCFNLSSTYAVLESNGGVIPVSVSDRVFQDLKDQFGDFKERRLVSSSRLFITPGEGTQNRPL